MMTKRHFEAIANAIVWVRDTSAPDASPYEVLIQVAHELADICVRENPNFDRSRFLRACGL